MAATIDFYRNVGKTRDEEWITNRMKELTED
jgi:hypothetical protein